MLSHGLNGLSASRPVVALLARFVVITAPASSLQIKKSGSASGDTSMSHKLITPVCPMVAL